MLGLSRRTAVAVGSAVFVVAALVAWLVSGLLSSPAPLSRRTPAPLARWRPLAPVGRDAETLYLLDAARERQLAPGDGGLISSVNTKGAPARGSPFAGVVKVVPGRFRAGLSNVGLAHPGYAWMPAEGMIGTNEFTVELWLRSQVAWSVLAPGVPFAVSDALGSEGLFLQVGKGRITLELRQAQQAAASTATLMAAASVPAGRWCEVAVTFSHGMLRLYLGGRLVASRAGVVGPIVWSGGGVQDGISLLGAPGNAPVAGPTSNLSISDLRISSVARVPGGRPSLVIPSVTVDSTRLTGGTVQDGLRGVLHSVDGIQPIVGNAVRVVRTDKLLTVTPIKSGAPDSSRPTAGVSGRYSYDWRVVDRSLAAIRALGATPYVSIDATPSLLGGSVSPYSGSQLSSALAYPSSFPPQVPNNFGAFATLVRDLVYHVVVQDGIAVPQWGVWNEPDIAPFWSGSVAQYVQLYAAVARAVKSVSPTLHVGGPEVASIDYPFFLPFLKAVAAEHLPLDFVSFHHYSGSLGDLFHAREIIDSVLHRAPPVTVGEWGPSSYELPSGPFQPWTNLNYAANDWAAAWDAANMIDMQRIGTTIGSLGQAAASPAAPFGLASPSTPLVTLNVFRLWHMLGPQLLSVSGYPGAGVTLQASRDRGHVYVLISHLRYRKDLSAKLRLHIPGAKPDAPVTRYQIDQAHSDFVDAGARHAALEQISSPPLQGTSITLSLPARAVTLLIAPR